MPTGFQLGSLDLRTLAHEIVSTNGWDVFPGMKSGGVQYAFQHGEYVGGRRFYKARDIDLNMVILATNAAGVVTTSAEEHVEENIETLMAALHNTFNPLTLTRTLPSGAVRTASVRPIDVARYEDNVGLSRLVTLVLRMGYPFWHGVAGQVVGSGPLSPNNLGTAPVNDMIVTFTTAGRVTHDLTSDYLEADAAGLVVNVGTGVITGGDSGDIHGNMPHWLQFEPGVNALTITGGTKTIDWFHGYF